MSRRSIVTHLMNENRGLKKRINHILKASLNNHTGMLYWKRKYKNLEYEVKDIVKSQQDDHRRIEDSTA
jgi:hypothetical protein